MDERLEQLANGLAGKADAVTGEGRSLSPGDIGGIFGDAVTDDTVTDDSILFAKVVCLDQKKRGVTYPDPDLESEYYDMVARLYF